MFYDQVPIRPNASNAAWISFSPSSTESTNTSGVDIR